MQLSYQLWQEQAVDLYVQSAIVQVLVAIDEVIL